MYPFPDLEPVCCSMSSFNCCFLTCIQITQAICIHISQEAGQVVWYSCLLKNFPVYCDPHSQRLWRNNKAEVDVFLEISCFFDDPTDVGNLISGSSAFSESNLDIWKFTVYVLLKPVLENFEHYFANLWDECNCVSVFLQSFIIWFFKLDVDNIRSHWKHLSLGEDGNFIIFFFPIPWEWFLVLEWEMWQNEVNKLQMINAISRDR